MTPVLVELEKRCPAPDPTESAPFPGPEWEEEDDLSVEWDEDWAWDGEGAWGEEAALPGKKTADRGEAGR